MANPKVRRCDALPVAAIMASTGSASTAINPDLDPSTDRNSIADCAAGITGPDNPVSLDTGDDSELTGVDLETDRELVEALQGVTSPALVLAAARVLRELRNDGVSRAAIDDLDAASAELADPAIRRAITNLRNDGIDAIDAGALRALVDGAA